MLKKKIQDWYGKYERPVSSLFLIGGFVLDALTIRMVSLYWQNIWIIANLIIISSCIVLVHVFQRNEGDEANSAKIHFWLVNILQFFFGSTLSTFLVFYFNGSDFFVSWPFLLVLAICFFANEKFKRSYVRLTFQLSLLFLTLFSFSIFLIPIALHRIGTGIFLLSGVVSIISICLISYLVRFFAMEEFEKTKKLLVISIGSIYIVVNFLYFSNIIPPIPFSLKNSGVFHTLSRKNGGDYLVTYEPKELADRLSIYPEFHKAPGELAYVYSAIFSPPKFSTVVFHEWQQRDKNTGKWVTANKVNLPIVGGRNGGFRTYSQKSNIQEGKWRVNVLTENGLVIGRIRFTVVNVNNKPILVEDINK